MDHADSRKESLFLIQQIKAEFLNRITVGDIFVKISDKQNMLAQSEAIAKEVKEWRILLSSIKRVEKKLMNADISNDELLLVHEEIVLIRDMTQRSTFLKGPDDADPK